MAVRYYLTPATGTGADVRGNQIRPAYFDPDTLKWDAFDYGMEPVFLVRADVTPAQHAAVTAHADVVAFPATLSSTVGANRDAVETALEAKGIPGDWVTVNMTYGTVRLWVARLFKLAVALHVRSGVRLLSAQTLSSLVSDLSAQRRAALADAAQSLGLDTSGVTGGMTIRAALKLLVNQITTSAVLGGEAL